MKKNRKVPFVEFYLNKYTNVNYKILDVGCGTAQYRNSTKAKYIGLDATKDDYGKDLPRDVNVIAKAQDIPFRSNSIDLIFTVGVLYLIGDYEKVILEFYRILKPTGRILLFDYNQHVQRILIKNDNKRNLPCWSQHELAELIKTKGFISCMFLPRISKRYHSLFKHVILLYQKLFSSWIIVTGTKSKILD
jgi:ubiquinone/menaquinone biosynthesis C-methylase UbiE